jgi:hypothetical protein
MSSLWQNGDTCCQFKAMNKQMGTERLDHHVHVSPLTRDRSDLLKEFKGRPSKKSESFSADSMARREIVLTDGVR